MRMFFYPPCNPSHRSRRLRLRQRPRPWLRPRPRLHAAAAAATARVWAAQPGQHLLPERGAAGAGGDARLEGPLPTPALARHGTAGCRWRLRGRRPLRARRSSSLGVSRPTAHLLRGSATPGSCRGGAGARHRREVRPRAGARELPGGCGRGNVGLGVGHAAEGRSATRAHLGQTGELPRVNARASLLALMAPIGRRALFQPPQPLQRRDLTITSTYRRSWSAQPAREVGCSCTSISRLCSPRHAGGC